MILTIDTTKNDQIRIAIFQKEKKEAELIVEARRLQAEKLLLTIEKILKENNKQLRDIKEIKVENTGDNFTALRIGIITANTLGFALGIPVKSFSDEDDDEVNDLKFSLVKPNYQREPNITKQSSNKLL